MACNCRTSSLRIFVQSLTRFPLAGSTPRPAGIVDSKVFGAFIPRGPQRSIAATSAAYFSRQTLSSSAHSQTVLDGQDKQSHDTSHPSHSTSTADHGDASASEVEQARNSNAIFDLSLESIDALVAGLESNPNEQIDHNYSTDGPRYDANIRRRQKAELSGPSRLKRSKIMPADKTPQKPAEPPAKKRELWQIQKEALGEKFPEGWNPRKKLSPDALEGIRALHTQYPQVYTTEALSNQFQVSPEAIRRILRSKWKPSTEEDEKRQERWYTRGKNIWSQMAELGTKPPKRWRDAGVTRDARFNKKKGPKMEYPFVPKWKEKESTQRKLGDSLL